MTPQENRSIIKNFFDQVLNGSAPFYLDGFISSHYVQHPSEPGQEEGREAVRARLTKLHDAFTDLHFFLDEMIAEGDRVLARWHLEGRHTGDFLGVPATDRKVHCTGMDEYRVKDRKITEHWHELDLFGLFQQLSSPEQTLKAG
ncbi:MAG: ester cyclase [Methylotenera sp.]|nr:ester cyclase [Oligoflexia bacterium]